MVRNKLVIFDYDGVIADSLGLWIKAFDIAGKSCNISYRLDNDAIGMLEHITFPSILRQAGLENSVVTDMYVAEILEIFTEGSGEVSFFEGISELIRKLKKSGNTICINTANNSAVVKKRLKEEGIFSDIEAVAGGDVSGSKSEKISSFLKQFAFNRKDAFMIGDSLGDITEGKKAGVLTVAAGYGWHSREKLLSGRPDYFCSTVAEMAAVFENHG